VVAAQAQRLPALLAQARQNEADLVILDTPPEADAIAAEAAAQADAILIPCRPSALDLDAIGASVRIARASGKPFYVVINAAPPQGVETDETHSAITGAGVELAPVVLHQRKAYASRMHEGRTAQEIEPKGKAAAEIRDLLLWVCDKVIKIHLEQVIEVTRQRA